MTAFWSFHTNCFSRAFGHLPEPWEGFISYEDDTCWNCFGECLVRRFQLKGYLEKQICPVCDGIGAIATSVQSYPFQQDWTDHPTYWHFVYINLEQNLFEIPKL